MSYDPTKDSAVLVDLESRRNALNSRISHTDTAIEGIRTLLEDGAAPPSVPQASVPQAPVPSQQLVSGKLATARAPRNDRHHNAPVGHPGEKAETDRRQTKAAVNVYVNRFPEWSSAMAQGKAVVRKQAGIRCPKCSSPDTRQSLTRGLADFFMFLFDYTNARCRNCNARFRVWRPQPGHQVQEDVPVPEKFTS